jgi:hypothetical protein
MPEVYVHTCNSCGYQIATTGGWEFSRNTDSEVVRLKHPVESEKTEIYGLCADMYCIDCKSIRDIILVEFKKPECDTFLVWSGRCEVKDEYKNVINPRCNVCGGNNLILTGEENKKVLCPQCEKSYLISTIEAIS